MAIEMVARSEDDGMVVASPYVIERVPCALPTLLVESGRLKRPPNMPSATVRGYRPATASDAHALTWLVAWCRGPSDATGLRRAAGAIAYIDRFEWHSSSEIREIVFLTGTPRACRDLVLHLRSHERRLVGLVDTSGYENLSGMMTKLGGKTTRVLVEDQA